MGRMGGEIGQESAIPHLKNTQEASILAETDLNHIASYDELYFAISPCCLTTLNSGHWFFGRLISLTLGSFKPSNRRNFCARFDSCCWRMRAMTAPLWAIMVIPCWTTAPSSPLYRMWPALRASKLAMWLSTTGRL